MTKPTIRILLCLSLLHDVGSAFADDVDEWYKLAERQQYGKVVPALELYLRDRPKDARARFLLGLIYTDQKKTEEAIAVFQSLSTDFPELPEPYNNLAVLHAEQGAYEQARQALMRAIQTHPSYATAHENLGDIYTRMASQAYSKALQLNQENPSAKAKLSLVKRIFSSAGTPPTDPPAGGKPTLVAKADPLVAKVEPPPKTELRPEARPEPAVVQVARPEPARPEIPAARVDPPAKREPPRAETTIKAVPERTEDPPANTEEHRVKESVIRTLNGWAAAWSAKDPVRYLSFYTADFRPHNQPSREAWERERAQRLRAPQFIQVKVSQIKLTLLPDGNARVSFLQEYRSDSYKDRINKSVLFKKDGGQWKIAQEATDG